MGVAVSARCTHSTSSEGCAACTAALQAGKQPPPTMAKSAARRGEEGEGKQPQGPVGSTAAHGLSKQQGNTCHPTRNIYPTCR